MHEFPHAGAFFLVPGVDEALRVNGAASLRNDEAFTSLCDVNGRFPKQVIHVAVKEAYTRFSRWGKNGVWQRVTKAVSDDQDLEVLFIDSTVVRAHQHAAGAQKNIDSEVSRVLRTLLKVDNTCGGVRWARQWRRSIRGASAPGSASSSSWRR